MNPKMVTLEQLQSEGTILLGRIRDFMDSGVDTLELEISDKFDGAYVDGGYLILCKGSQELQLGPFASGDSDLPEVTIADNGKVLKVVNGVWAKGIDATGGGGSYDDTELRGRISAIENKESGWNAKYTKPSSGIPKTDLASAVQSSLNKADNALQSVPNTYRTAAQQDIIDNGKLSDAPSNGKIYGRKNGAWSEVISGGGGAEVFIVTITQSGGVFSADKTNAEIYAAAQANNIVIAIITVSGSRMPLLSATSTKAVFADTMRTQDVHNGTLTIENNVVTAVDTELQSAEISDVADYFTDKTVEGALAEIGAKLAAYPSDVWEGGSYGS